MSTLMELKEFEPQDDDSFATTKLIDILPSLTEDISPTWCCFQCKCQPESIESQRNSTLADLTVTQRQSEEIDTEDLANAETQLKTFGQLNRTSLARNLRFKLKKRVTYCETSDICDKHSFLLYRLEQLTRAADENLKLELSSNVQQNYVTKFKPSVIRPPIRFSSGVKVRSLISHLSGSSGSDSGVDSSEHEPLERPPIVALLKGLLDFKVTYNIGLLVSESIEFFESLANSSPLFNHFLGLKNPSDQSGDTQLTCQELKLYACVECQKLRAAIRFTWLTKCLEMTFREKITSRTSNDDPKIKLTRGNESTNFLPAIESLRDDKTSSYRLDVEFEESRHLDLLALLMGLLLRQHFLVVGLSHLIGVLESDHLASARCHADTAKLMVIVNLQELERQDDSCDQLLSHGNVQMLTCSKPQDEIKKTMNFIVDEIAAVCTNLPRVETQLNATSDLECFSPHLSTNPCTYSSEGRKFISVLQSKDQLLTETKQRLSDLIDGLRPIAKQSTQIDAGVADLNKFTLAESSSQLDEPQSSLSSSGREVPTTNDPRSSVAKAFDGPERDDSMRLGSFVIEANKSSWIDSRYLQIVDIVNKFRLGDGPTTIIPLATREPSTNSLQPSEYIDSRIQKLRVTCHQIRLLDQMEFELKCKLNRYFDFGFVKLDCEPLRESLCKHVQQERRLLVRFNLDELGKLMERLKLQFDDIELNIDLESAVEDYLADRWQAKQSQPVSSASQLILASDRDDDDDQELDRPEANLEGLDQDQAEEQLEERQTNETDEDAFLDSHFTGTADSTGNAQHQRQLMALMGPKDNATPGDQVDRQVAPLIECRLLLEKFNYFGNLLANELNSLIVDVDVVFEGLIFVSEFVASEQLEASHWDLITELALRSRDFASMLKDSLDRLNSATLRLRESNALRSRSLNKLVLEFHRLAIIVSRTRLSESSDKMDDANSTIRQLDSIQETSSWAQKIQVRCQFLNRFNSLLIEEFQLLRRTKLSKGDESEQLRSFCGEDDSSDHEHRDTILELWRPLVALMANTWRLAEDFETQQVKWLNSDTKRFNFTKIDSIFVSFNSRLNDLREEIRSLIDVQLNECRHVISLNIEELGRRLQFFSKQRLPIFKFLANPHLTSEHWDRVAELSSKTMVGGSSSMVPQMCTTVGQLLDLNVDQFVDQLEAINRQATVEHELTMFLLAEAAKTHYERKRQVRSSKQISGNLLANWTDTELTVAAQRFIEIKLGDNQQNSIEWHDCLALAHKLVAVHSLIKRYLRLKGSLSIDIGNKLGRSEPNLPFKDKTTLFVHATHRLTSPKQVNSSMFVDLLKLFIEDLSTKRTRLFVKIQQIQLSSQNITDHLIELEQLINRVKQMEEYDLKDASEDIESALAKLEGESIRLELERETLATKEALALEKQRDALKTRDQLIRQITERAIPALRAAGKALDCLDDKCLRNLRYLRPSPPASVRLVLEAVCLLRSCANSSGQTSIISPERHFDSLKGEIVEDYWPVANRMLNATHSVKFLQDLRRVDKKSIPNKLMRLIRRRYMSSPLFDVRSIEKVSPEAATMAKWLIAVDVFDRVINVVKPNYYKYMESERNLSLLLSQVSDKRVQIEAVGVELQRLGDYFSQRITNRATLVESLAECKLLVAQVDITSRQLKFKRSSFEKKLNLLRLRQKNMAKKCLLKAATLVYLEQMEVEDREPSRRLVIEVIGSEPGEQ